MIDTGKKPKAKPNQSKAKKPAAPAKPGRPSSYSDAVADVICARVAGGEALYKICQEPEMPCLTAVYSWLRRNEAFAQNYARAKEDLADTMASRIQAIVEEAPAVSMDGKVDSGWVQYQRLKVDTLKWQAGKLKPKVYGDKIDLNHGNQPENPLTVLLQQVSGTALPVVKDADEE